MNKKKYIEFKNKYKNKNILIMGLGLNGGGVGSAKFFSKLGANVLITDLKQKKDLLPSIKQLKGCKNIKYILGRHREEDFKTADLIIKNPGVRNNSKFLKIAADNNVEIDTDIGIFFELCNNKIIGITGSKGKSTTTKLISEILKTKYRVFVGGNYRLSVLDMLYDLEEKDIVVLELSSWQLEGLEQHKKSPYISVLTNLYEDHLNTYNNSMQEYADAKSIIFKFQNKKDFAIINSDNDNIFKYFNLNKIKSNKILFGRNKKFINKSTLNRTHFLFNNKNILNINDNKLLGDHNIQNIMAAIAVVKIMKVSNINIKHTIKNFKMPEGRQELIREFKGIKFINDTTATSPTGTIQAINSFNKNIILIAGGVDKNLDYKNLCKILIQKYNKKELKCLILLKDNFTTTTNKILNIIDNKVKYYLVTSMKNAVNKAYSNAKNGDVIILSPGGASFGMFKNEFDRGEQFNKEVKKLK